MENENERPVMPGIWCDGCGVSLDNQATFGETIGRVLCGMCADEYRERQWEQADSEDCDETSNRNMQPFCDECGTRHSFWVPCPDRFAGVPTPVEQAAFDGGLVGRVEAMSNLPLCEVFSRAEIARLEWLRHAVASGVIQQG